MTIDEAKHKMDFLKKAYQKLLDEKVDSGKLVGDGVMGEWKAETPIDEAYKSMIEALETAIKVLEQTSWIPVSERLPEDLVPVNITWVNHEPEPYYHDIKDRNFEATGIHYRGQWYWYSTTCADYLGEYGDNEIDKVDDAIEITAWMPLPQRYEVESEVTE